jgi:hypothetical protein
VNDHPAAGLVRSRTDLHPHAEASGHGGFQLLDVGAGLGLFGSVLGGFAQQALEISDGQPLSGDDLRESELLVRVAQTREDFGVTERELA